MLDLTGKTAVVTGAGRGIGETIARLLAEQGAAVVVADINLDTAAAVAADIQSAGGIAAALHCDVSDPQSITQLFDAGEAQFGAVDVLVNNAGIGNFKPMPEVTLEEWDRVVDINLRGVHLCSQRAMIPMCERKSGKIINISSMGGQLGGLKVAPDYTAAKAGVIGLTKSYARYGARYGVNVNAVAPGPTATEMAAGHFDPSSAPLGRLGTPQDIANAVLFLASSMSDYITGATIDVNGGMLMR